MTSQNKLLLAVLMIIIAISLVGWGIWLWSLKPPTNNNANTANTNISNTNAALNENVNSQQLNVNSQPIDTSDWQTYRNEELGFEVKYPEGWKVEILPNEIKLFNPQFKYYNNYLKENILPFAVYIKRDTKLPSDILEDIKMDATDIPINFDDIMLREVINGYDAIVIKPYSNAEGTSAISYALIPKGNFVFIIKGFKQFSSDNPFSQIFPTIYKTFQLVGK